ncbi:MAG: hypothetical protein JST16_08445 [Bdellovibrionales bacterium]|nr:hypothetical protein [Bdellovibrionales bacterium]
MSTEISVFELLRAAFDRQALGHALLFVTPSISDAKIERELTDFRALLLCSERKEGERACGRCSSCQISAQMNQGAAHPDLFHLESPEGTPYSVDDARRLLEQFSLSRSLAPNRVAWINDAHLLSAQGQSAAANALLKLLEEPRPQSFLVLITSKPDSVLPTIRSRCHHFRLPRAAEETLPASDLEILEKWQALEHWLRAGAPIARGPELPADEDAFWKDRDRALQEMESLWKALWLRLRADWAHWDREQSLRVFDFFKRLESCLAAVRGYGNAPLQWLSLRSDARLDA